MNVEVLAVEVNTAGGMASEEIAGLGGSSEENCWTEQQRGLLNRPKLKLTPRR